MLLSFQLFAFVFFPLFFFGFFFATRMFSCHTNSRMEGCYFLLSIMGLWRISIIQHENQQWNKTIIQYRWPDCGKGRGEVTSPQLIIISVQNVSLSRTYLIELRGGGRERQADRETKKDRDKERERDRDRETHRETETETERQKREGGRGGGGAFTNRNPNIKATHKTCACHRQFLCETCGL